MANTAAKKITYDNKPVQVESAIRDGTGKVIADTYAKKPAVYERTTNSSTSTTCTLIQFNASDYKANGYLAHFRFRVRSTLQDAYPSDNEFIINYSYRTAMIVVLNSKWSTSNDIVQTIYAYFPSSDTYLDTGNYLIAFRTGRASTNFIIEMIEADVPYTVPATMSASTTTNATYQSLTPGSYSSTYPLMWTGQALGNINGGSAYSSYAYGTKQGYFRVGESDFYKIMAVDHTGIAYKINTSTKKFPLPISMYCGTGSSADITTGEGCASTRSVSVSYLTSSSYNNFTMPTLTASDGGKTLYIRGSLDADGYFVCDGNVTLSMEAGYTYIPFGTLEPRYSGSTAQAPIQFSFNAISASAFTLDANGKLTHVDGREVGGSSDGTVQLQDVIVGSSSNPWILNTAGSTAPLYDEEFPYYSIITRNGVTSNTYVQVAYSSEQSMTMYYSPTAQTDTNKIYIFARADMGQQVIPTISIGMDHSDITVDSTPISGSTNPISSGGVYANCVRIDGAQTVVGEKSFQGITYKAISGTFDTSSAIHSPIYWRDGSSNVGAWVERQGSTVESTSQVNIGVREFLSGNQNIAMMNLRVNSSGTAWVEAPSRTYDQANTRDVVTIGTLNQNIRMSGNKWFTTSDGASVHLLDTRKTRGTTPSSDQYTILYFVDKNNVELGSVYHSLFADSANRMCIKTVKDNNNWIALNVQISNDGNQVVSKDGAINGSYYWSEFIDQNTVQGVDGIKYFGPYTAKIRLSSVDRRYRPSSYYCAGLQFVDGNSNSIGELRMTYDAQGSRRIEVCVFDASGGEHWTVLANITV